MIRKRFPLWQKQALALAVLLAVIAAVATLIFRPSHSTIPRVLVEGGVLHNIPASNSLQAFDAAYENGFRTFNVPFRLTEDNVLVCIANWQAAPRRIFTHYQPATPSRPMTLSEFTSLPVAEELRPCTLDTFLGWRKQHPDASLVADLRTPHPLNDFQALKAALPSFASQIIPQVYTPQTYRAVRNMGYARAIFAASNPPHPPALGGFRNMIQQLKPYAVAIPGGRAMRDDALVKGLKDAGVPIYAGVVNNCAQFGMLKKRGISEIYTTTLSLKDCAR